MSFNPLFDDDWIVCPNCKKKICKKIDGIAVGEYECRSCRDANGNKKKFRVNTLLGLKMIGFEKNSQKEIILKLGR